MPRLKLDAQTKRAVHRLVYNDTRLETDVNDKRNTGRLVAPAMIAAGTALLIPFFC